MGLLMARTVGYFLSSRKPRNADTSYSLSNTYLGKILGMERDAVTVIVAKNIEALMVERRTNAADLARKARVNPTGVYDILSGKSRSPRIETLAKIASALGVPVALLFEDRADSALRAEIETLFSQLPPEEQQRLVLTARAWLGGPESV